MKIGTNLSSSEALHYVIPLQNKKKIIIKIKWIVCTKYVKWLAAKKNKNFSNEELVNLVGSLAAAGSNENHNI